MRAHPAARTDHRRAWLSAALLLAAALPTAARGQEPTPLPPSVADAPAASMFEGQPRADAPIEVRLGHGRILTLRDDLFAGGKAAPTIAVGDPGLLEFTALSARQIRLVGTRLGSTDLAVTAADGKTTSFDVRIVVDIQSLREQLRLIFPDAALKLAQIGTRLVVEGQARDAAQVAQILRVLRTSGGPSGPLGAPAPATANPPPAGMASTLGPGAGAAPAPSGDDTEVEVVNLIRVPGSQQVLLKVRVAELNRTAFRQIGANALGYDSRSGSIFGSQIGGPITGGAGVTPIGDLTNQSQARGLLGTASSSLTSAGTVFGIFQNSNFEVYLNALRRNSILKILAEPNLMALNGHQASFLAGGEFPIPVPQVGASGVASTITVQFKKFGVQLDFLPIILDGDAIRLTVDPVVSSIDFSIGTTLVAGGSPVPGLNTRQAHTTVELKQGQTLAIAGLMQLSLDGTTNRVPGLGDLPILGPFFSNTTSNRVEKELVVLVTPYLVEPMAAGQVPPGPGDEVNQPNDLEFYFLNRIEGRTGHDHRATTEGADPLRVGRAIHLERKFVRGPVGFGD